VEFGWFTAVKPRGSRSMNPRLVDPAHQPAPPASVHEGGPRRVLAGTTTDERRGANLAPDGGSLALMIAARLSAVRGHLPRRGHDWTSCPLRDETGPHEDVKDSQQALQTSGDRGGCRLGVRWHLW
jgi:hypothetical protein